MSTRCLEGNLRSDLCLGPALTTCHPQKVFLAFILLCLDMCVDMCSDMCLDMCSDKRSDMCLDTCPDLPLYHRRVEEEGIAVMVYIDVVYMVMAYIGVACIPESHTSAPSLFPLNTPCSFPKIDTSAAAFLILASLQYRAFPLKSLLPFQPFSEVWYLLAGHRLPVLHRR